MAHQRYFGSFDRKGKTIYYSDCPFCSHRIEFFEEHTQSVKECPICSLPVRFEKHIGKFITLEEIKYEIVSGVQGESFSRDGFVVENGVLVRYDGQESLLTIPQGVAVLGEDVFKDNTKLKEVVLPKGVIGIDGGAFEGCSHLRKLELPDGLLVIGTMAFSGCRKLEKIKVPSTLLACGYGLFYDCETLEEIEMPMDMRYVAGSIYFNCRKLKRANVPHYVNDFGDWWFRGCESLEVVTFGRGIDRIEHTPFPKLKLAYFFEREEWKTVGAHFPAETLKDPKKAAQLLKKYAFEKRSLYMPKKWEKRHGIWDSYHFHDID